MTAASVPQDLENAIWAITNRYGCFGSCDAGKVSGSHLANHSTSCARLRILLGQSVPRDYEWDGERLKFAPTPERLEAIRRGEF